MPSSLHRSPGVVFQSTGGTRIFLWFGLFQVNEIGETQALPLAFLWIFTMRLPGTMNLFRVATGKLEREDGPDAIAWWRAGNFCRPWWPASLLEVFAVRNFGFLQMWIYTVSLGRIIQFRFVYSWCIYIVSGLSTASRVYFFKANKQSMDYNAARSVKNTIEENLKKTCSKTF